MKTALCIAVVAALTIPQISHAQGYTGFGTPDCGKWLAETTQTRKAWLLGFLTGMSSLFNAMELKPRDPLSALGSAEQAFAWMDKYCREKPLENVGSGAEALWMELMKKKSPGK